MSQSTPRRGFTLIELLVVISIIALLISILLPALRQARQSAYQLKCLANEKQIMLAAIAYSNDNQDYIPPTRFAGFLLYPADLNAHFKYNTWRTNLTPYLSARSANHEVWALTLTERDEYNKVWHQIACPAQDVVTVAGQDGLRMTYGMAAGRASEYALGQGMQAVSGSFKFRRFDEATMASETLAYLDIHGTDYIYPGFATALPLALQDLLVPARHPNRSYSTGMLDGHAEVTEREVLIDPQERLWYYIR